MQPRETSHMFNFKYEKTAAEILPAIARKTEEIVGKIHEREERIAALREEYGIDDQALVNLLTQARRNDRATSYAYTANSYRGGDNQVSAKEVMGERTIGAGVVNHLLTENDFVEADKATLERFRVISANLRPLTYYSSTTGEKYSVDSFPLDGEELKYLGFVK